MPIVFAPSFEDGQGPAPAMITEAINYAATWPLTGVAYRQHIRASINLWSRARRCSLAWAAHEARCKAVILDVVAGLATRRTVVVLGSGLLRDAPIKPLAAAFDTVVLVDIVHVASVRFWARAAGLRNLRFIERDLSGFGALQAGTLPEPLAFLRQVPYLDLVISANLLSQIGTGVRRRLDKGRHPSGLPEHQPLIAPLVRALLAGLDQVAARTCLMTDVNFSVIDRNGQLRETVDLMAGVPLPRASASWDWTVVPFGEESRDYRIDHRVVAIVRA